jgi:hypothetical protein
MDFYPIDLETPQFLAMKERDMSCLRKRIVESL